jgi:hypothetical protein
MHKFKRFRGKYAKAMAWLQKVYQYQPRLVSIQAPGLGVAVGDHGYVSASGAVLP